MSLGLAKTARARLACVIAAAATGCGGGGGGGDDTGGACGEVAPCGGDIVGTWAPAGSCVSPAPFLRTLGAQLGLTCPAGRPTTLGPSTVGRRISTSLAADGTYTGSSELSGSLNVDIPASCLDGGTCVDLDAAFRAMIDPARGIVEAGCTGAATCACSLVESASSSEAGTYTTSGSILQTVNADGTATQTDYCVRGTRLHFINLDTDAPRPEGEAAIASDTVLERR